MFLSLERIINSSIVISSRFVIYMISQTLVSRKIVHVLKISQNHKDTISQVFSFYYPQNFFNQNNTWMGELLFSGRIISHCEKRLSLGEKFLCERIYNHRTNKLINRQLSKKLLFQFCNYHRENLFKMIYSTE